MKTTQSIPRKHPGLIAGLAVLSVAWSASAFDVKVTIENLSPMNGTFLTPVWVGFHDGTFDLYDSGQPASAALERLAEDGNTMPVSMAFAGSGAGTVDGTLISGGAIPPFAPGDAGSMVFGLDPSAPSSMYFSYASMIIPSNDAFIANGNPLAHPIFDAAGNFLGADFFVLGSAVLDAGTEINDEIPLNTAFFGQMAADTGGLEGGAVGLHPGFISGGAILSDPMFANADFSASGYQVARIRVTAADLTPVPEVSTSISAVALAGLIGAGWLRRAKRTGVAA